MFAGSLSSRDKGGGEWLLLNVGCWWGEDSGRKGREEVEWISNKGCYDWPTFEKRKLMLGIFKWVWGAWVHLGWSCFPGWTGWKSSSLIGESSAQILPLRHVVVMHVLVIRQLFRRFAGQSGIPVKWWKDVEMAGVWGQNKVAAIGEDLENGSVGSSRGINIPL